MNIEEVNKIIVQMEGEEHDTFQKKGNDYTGKNEDRLANFKESAKELGLTPMQVWAIYYRKHHCAVMSYIKNGKVESEAIEGRIMDLRNYLVLLRCMIEEEKQWNELNSKMAISQKELTALQADQLANTMAQQAKYIGGTIGLCNVCNGKGCGHCKPKVVK